MKMIFKNPGATMFRSAVRPHIKVWRAVSDLAAFCLVPKPINDRLEVSNVVEAASLEALSLVVGDDGKPVLSRWSVTADVASGCVEIGGPGNFVESYDLSDKNTMDGKESVLAIVATDMMMAMQVVGEARVAAYAAASPRDSRRSRDNSAVSAELRRIEETQVSSYLPLPVLISAARLNTENVSEWFGWQPFREFVWNSLLRVGEVDILCRGELYRLTAKDMSNLLHKVRKNGEEAVGVLYDQFGMDLAVAALKQQQSFEALCQDSDYVYAPVSVIPHHLREDDAIGLLELAELIGCQLLNESGYRVDEPRVCSFPTRGRIVIWPIGKSHNGLEVSRRGVHADFGQTDNSLAKEKEEYRENYI